MSHPGGIIVFYEPILEVFDNVDQLAMVMSHEIAHVLQRHVCRQISKSFLNICSMTLMFAAFDFGLTEIYFSEHLESTFKLKHSRVHEMRADEQGL